jgi:hypothetical protein
MAIDKSGAYEKGTFKHVVFLNDVTASTDSAAQIIAGAKKITLFLKRSNHSAGSSAFKVQLSIDGGTTWVDYNGLITNVTNTNAQTLTRVGSVTLSSDTSSIVAVDLAHYNAHLMRVVVTETTDGTHRAEGVIEF